MMMIVWVGVEDELLGVLEGLQRVLLGTFPVVAPGEETGVQPGLVPVAQHPQECER